MDSPCLKCRQEFGQHSCCPECSNYLAVIRHSLLVKKEEVLQSDYVALHPDNLGYSCYLAAAVSKPVLMDYRCV